MNVPDRNLSAAPAKAFRVAVIHGSVVKTNKTQVLVTTEREKCVCFSGFWGKAHARAEVKHTTYFEQLLRSAVGKTHVCQLRLFRNSCN